MRSTDLFIFTILMSVIFLLPMIFMRYKKEQLRHSERMAALEKGAELPAFPVEAAPWTPRVYLLRGLIWLFAGIGLTVFLTGVALTTGRMETLEDRMWRVHELRQRGVQDEDLKRLQNSPLEQREHLPEGFALIGLIPIGVGIAYIIFYQGERKQLLV